MPSYDPLFVAFTLDQLAELLAWSATNDGALDLRIATDHVYLPEVAIVFVKGQPARVRYMLNPVRNGSLMLMRPTAGHWYVASVQEALATIDHLERLVSR